jgi:hypothetical protein
MKRFLQIYHFVFITDKIDIALCAILVQTNQDLN